MKQFLICILFLLLTSFINIPKNKIGIVLDYNTGETLAGVKIKTNNNIIYSDFDGIFYYNPHDTLYISYISYTDTIIYTNNKYDTLIIKLK